MSSQSLARNPALTGPKRVDKDLNLGKVITMVSPIILSSIPLIERRPGNIYPINSASGCFINYSGKKFLLSVSHATNNGGDWAIEMKILPPRAVQVYPLGRMGYLEKGDIKTVIQENIDFSFKKVPSDVVPLWQEMQEDGTIINEMPKLVCEPEFNFIPDGSRRYGFFGRVPVRRENWIMVFNPVFEKDMTFDRIQGDYYMFKLSREHPGHEYFKGCSGAPIIDYCGKTVALVCRGCVEENTIIGISLSKYKIVLDIEIGKFDSPI